LLLLRHGGQRWGLIIPAEVKGAKADKPDNHHAQNQPQKEFRIHACQTRETGSALEFGGGAPASWRGPALRHC
jgi:hypothetical protein